MVRKIETEKVKRKSKIKGIIIFLVILAILGGSAFYVVKYVLPKLNKPEKVIQEVVILDSLDDYGYSISDRDSKYYQSEYDVLKEILHKDTIDYQAYATQVAKMFTIDLYTLSTKINKYDIGGSEFYYVTKKEMFEQKVMDTLYSTMLDDSYGDRKQILPEVKEVTVVSTTKTTYTLNKKKVDAYLVKVKIEYVDDLKYDKVGSVIVCQEGKGIRYSVVDFQPTHKPSYK